jgi:hypothetical protein
MQAVSFPERQTLAGQTRAGYRHELRTLTYVTLDQANGGIIRNLNHEGVAVQAVGPLREHQRVRLRFELRFPRLRVDTYGEVSWASSSGQCGIRFMDLPERTSHQINEWMFSNLLDAIARDASHPHSIFGTSVVSVAREGNARGEEDREELAAGEYDGLTLSAPSRSAIPRKPGFTKRRETEGLYHHPEQDLADSVHEPLEQPNWLSRPLSGRTLAWLVDSLVMTAGLLLFALIFLSIAHELPPWPLTLGTASAAAVFVAATYWTLFAVFGGPSVGARLAQAASALEEEKESRFSHPLDTPRPWNPETGN